MKITPTTCDGAPIVLIYGGEGRGKTTLACKFPKPVAMLLERGLPRGVSVDAIDGLGSYDNVVEAAARALSRSAAGKGRGASYAMARNGKMPVVDVGGTKIVPRAPWLKQLGADPDTFESVGSAAARVVET